MTPTASFATPSDAAPLRAELPGLIVHVRRPRRRRRTAPGRRRDARRTASSTSPAPPRWPAPGRSPSLPRTSSGSAQSGCSTPPGTCRSAPGRKCASCRLRAPRSSVTPCRSRRTRPPPHAPVTPYGAAKDFAHTMVQVYRRRGMFAAAAILYNHESPRRPSSFVARKITRAVAAIARGRSRQLTLGNIDALRRLGLRPGPRRRHDPHPGGRPARRLRRGDRRGSQRPRLRARGVRGGRDRGLGVARRHRPGALPAGRPARPGRRPDPAAIPRLATVRSGSRSSCGSWSRRTWTRSTAPLPARPHAQGVSACPAPTHAAPRTCDPAAVGPGGRADAGRAARHPRGVPRQRARPAGRRRTSGGGGAPRPPSRPARPRPRHGATVVDDNRTGLSGAVNTGIAARRGGEEFYAWLGDDDLLLPGGLATLAGLLARHGRRRGGLRRLPLHRRAAAAPSRSAAPATWPRRSWAGGRTCCRSRPR